MNKNFRLFLLAFTSFGSGAFILPIVLLSIITAQEGFIAIPEFFASPSQVGFYGGLFSFAFLTLLGLNGIAHALYLAISGKEWV